MYTLTMGPSPRARYGWLLMCTMAGSMKERVLPEPVSAIPIILRPDMAMGHPCAWIAVGFSKFSVRRVSLTYSE